MKKIMKTIGVLVLVVFGIKLALATEFKKESISGPYRHENLEIFLIRKDGVKSKGHKYISLEKAIEKKIVTVHETGNVQNLSIENTSGDVYIYINSGDIVKGGKQDRVIRFDLVLKPKSGKVPLASFCVESGRWQKRSGEAVNKFSSSKQMVSSRNLKVAAKYVEDQGEVWKQVSKQQNKLNESLRQKTGKNNLDVRNAESASSMQLTLENKDLKKHVAEYKAALSKIINNEKNVVGFAFAINGELVNADVYSDPDLFRSLWPKLLKSAIVEAISEFDKNKEQTAHLKKEAVEQMFLDAEKSAKIKKKDINENTKMKTLENDDYLMFETNEEGKKEWLHRNYIKKGAEQKQPVNQQPQPNSLQINLRNNQEIDIQRLQQMEVQQRQIRR